MFFNSSFSLCGLHLVDDLPCSVRLSIFSTRFRSHWLVFRVSIGLLVPKLAQLWRIQKAQYSISAIMLVNRGGDKMMERSEGAEKQVG